MIYGFSSLFLWILFSYTIGKQLINQLALYKYITSIILYCTKRRSQGAALATKPQLILLCHTLHSIIYTGCYDCAHKNVSSAVPSKLSGNTSACTTRLHKNEKNLCHGTGIIQYASIQNYQQEVTLFCLGKCWFYYLFVPYNSPQSIKNELLKPYIIESPTSPITYIQWMPVIRTCRI